MAARSPSGGRPSTVIRPERFVRPPPPELLRQIERDDIEQDRLHPPVLPGWACALGAAILCPFVAAFLAWSAQ